MPPYTLVIVESPAKCGKIAGFLGPNYKCIASMGHIRALEPSLESVGIDRDFDGTYVFMKEKAKAVNAIKAAAAEAGEVILASDDDREGEAISYSIAVLLKLPLHITKRAVFHEITRPAVTRAVAEPRLIDMAKVHAQMARAQLDMMIGFTISPLLWKHVARGLSAGRCQTPALRLIVDREAEVTGFSTSTGWVVTGTWNGLDAALTDELEDEESAGNYMEGLAGIDATIKDVKTRPWTESAPLPLITSSLQMAASSLFRANPKTTMQVAQRLYEAGHITYMRTDKAVLGEEATEEAKATVQRLFGADFVGQARQPKGGAAAAQEAHEAIRPTHFEVDGLAGAEWTSLDKNIYRLIRVRALQSVMAPARGRQATVRFAANDDPDGDFMWSASARTTDFQGWRAAGRTNELDDEEAEADSQGTFAAIQSLTVGSSLSWAALAAAPRTTKAPPRFNEATLVKELEERGIGRPSTFASLIATIQEKDYVEKKTIEGRKIQVPRLSLKVGNTIQRQLVERSVGGERDRLVPTNLGTQMLAFALEHFSDLFAYEFTAAMENRLDAVADRGEPWKQVLRDTWTTYKDRYEALNTGGGRTTAARERVFADGLKAVMTRKGPMLLREGAKTVFYPWPKDAEFETLTEEVAIAATQAEVLGTTAAGAQIMKKNGKFGAYATDGTVNVPLTADDTEESLRAKFAAKAAISETRVGPFTFRVGQYGPYMYKTDLKTKKFVPVPASIDAKALTIREADDIYKRGLEAAAARPQKFTPKSRS
jgi:DNA topoisomerase-1